MIQFIKNISVMWFIFLFCYKIYNYFLKIFLFWWFFIKCLLNNALAKKCFICNAAVNLRHCGLCFYRGWRQDPGARHKVLNIVLRNKVCKSWSKLLCKWMRKTIILLQIYLSKHQQRKSIFCFNRTNRTKTEVNDYSNDLKCFLVKTLLKLYRFLLINKSMK